MTARRILVAVAAVLITAAAVLLVVKLLEGEDDEVALKDDAGVELTLPKPEGWKELSESEREELPGEPLTVLRREDRKGLVVVNVQQGPAGDFRKLAHQLDRRLARRFPDFRKVRSRTVRVGAGRGLLYSYARRRKGTANTLLVVPAGNRAYTLNAVVPGGEEEAAREVGEILLGFKQG